MWSRSVRAVVERHQLCVHILYSFCIHLLVLSLSTCISILRSPDKLYLFANDLAVEPFQVLEPINDGLGTLKDVLAHDRSSGEEQLGGRKVASYTLSRPKTKRNPVSLHFRRRIQPSFWLEG